MLHRPVLMAWLAVAALLSVYAWAVFVLSFHHDGLIGPRFNAPGADYIVYYTAARDFLAGDLRTISDAAAFTAQQNREFADRLSGQFGPHPWVYPPPFLMLLVPFAGLNFVWSYAAFMSATLAVTVVGASCIARAPRQRMVWVLALVMAPATAIDAITGQNALLTAGILLGGVGLLGRSPVLAGALFGLLIYKPQFALMIPCALIGHRDRRALIAAGSSAVALASLSVVTLGPEIWQIWLTWLTQRNADYVAWLEWGRSWGLSVDTCAQLLGAGPRIANLLQAGAVVAAGAGVHHAFRSTLALDLRLAALCGATILAAPHVSPYDLVLFACAAIVLHSRVASAEGPFAPLLLLLLWAAPLLGPPRASPAGFAVPLLAAALIVYALRAGRHSRPWRDADAARNIAASPRHPRAVT